jgi:putative transcriptional regulator
LKNSIKVERARKNISQAELADKLKVSRLTIHSIETGKFNPSIQLAMRLAKHFKMQVEDLFELEDEDQ